MGTKIYQVDSFTKVPFAGNPAGVCVLDDISDEIWMQKVAGEMNLSETAFVKNIGQNKYELRWFTPKAEVDLCGHATLAAAHIIWEKGFLSKNDAIEFSTKSGILTCKNTDNKIEMSFPKEEATAISPPKELIDALSVNPLYTGKNRFDYLVEVESEDILKNLSPDFSLLGKVAMRGVIVTSKSHNYDFVSRFFAPAVGINEDPVTGSAHCCLAPYWAKKLNKAEMNARQVSERSGELTVRVENDRVYLTGKAITVMEGILLYETNYR